MQIDPRHVQAELRQVLLRRPQSIGTKSGSPVRPYASACVRGLISCVPLRPPRTLAALPHCLPQWHAVNSPAVSLAWSRAGRGGMPVLVGGGAVQWTCRCCCKSVESWWKDRRWGVEGLGQELAAQPVARSLGGARGVA